MQPWLAWERLGSVKGFLSSHSALFEGQEQDSGYTMLASKSEIQLPALVSQCQDQSCVHHHVRL